MEKTTALQDRLIEILELARLSPSVHNSQPWKISVAGDTLLVNIDHEHVLKDGDPTGRETIISLGIFCQGIIMAAENLGFKLNTVSFDTDNAKISFSSQLVKPSENSKKNAELLKSRCSDRSIYEPASISDVAVNALKNSAHEKNVKVWIATDRDEIETTAQLTAQGINMALSNPSFREELSHYLVPAWSKKHRGIAIGSLYLPGPIGIIEPLLIRSGIRLGAEAHLEKQRWQSSSAVIFITTSGDMPDDWFNAGQVYLKLSLKIEDLGLSQATSAATVEASNFHEDIESMLGTKQRLQSVLRIGKGKSHRTHSPRLTAAELLAT